MYWRPRSPVSTLESSRRNGVVSSSRISECRKPRPPGLVGPDRSDVLGTHVIASSLRRPVAGHGGGFALACSMVIHKTARLHDAILGVWRVLFPGCWGFANLCGRHTNFLFMSGFFLWVCSSRPKHALS